MQQQKLKELAEENLESIFYIREISSRRFYETFPIKANNWIFKWLTKN